MRVETRRRVSKERSAYYDLVLIADDEMEQAKIDMVFGSRVLDDDGLIGTGTAECRLSDGHRDHYIHISAAPLPGDQNE